MARRHLAASAANPALRVAPDAPWLRALNGVGLVVLNVGLVAEISLVFVNTIARAVYHEVVPGVEETAQLLLVYIAFIGGGIAYGKGRFIAITVFVAMLLRAGHRQLDRDLARCAHRRRRDPVAGGERDGAQHAARDPVDLDDRADDGRRRPGKAS